MPSLILKGDSVILRDAISSDLHAYRRWMRQGVWRDFDAPWERAMMPDDLEAIERRFRDGFLGEPSKPRHSMIVALEHNHPIGWVNRYEEKRFPQSWNIGINICEDDQLDSGYGTEALHLWIEYLFANAEIHRLAFATYSFNNRVIRIAEKLGFTLEGKEREIIRWQDHWIDRLHFSLLRQEWKSQESRRSGSLGA
jgi:RimJ/RimL family protein N-acetyltransferase